jgi:uncharacterized membrane protein
MLMVIGLVAFLAPHALPMAPPLREGLVRRWGENRYKIVFSLVSAAGLAMIVAGYATGERGTQWFAPSPAARAIAPSSMTVAFILLAAAHGPSHLRALLRHPMLIGVLIWSVVHLLANGDARGTVLFGALAAYAAIDLLSVVSRGAVASFVPRWRSDVIAVVAGIAVALLVMLLHRYLFSVRVVPFGL